MQAVLALWQLEPLARESLFAAPAFVRLREICQKLYCDKDCSNQGLKFPLQNALLSLGLPAILTPSAAHLALSPGAAAVQLDAAFRQRESRRLHLCPLDCADARHFPVLKFGPASVQMKSAADLEACVDVQRLKRFNPNWIFDAERFSQFSWLVVEEVIPLNTDPDTRAGFNFSFNANQDFREIRPHLERFPTAVEAALFALLLLPWDRWARFPDFNSFSIPWVYTINDDIFRWPSEPPSPDTLSWEPDFLIDRDGKEVESERPVRFPIKERVSEAHTSLNDTVWSDLMRVRKSPLFESPIAHFLVRGFVSDGVDEFLAHVMVIEAALGLEIDYDGKRRNKLPVKKQGATFRLATRLSALLGSKRAGEDFDKLFDLRSAFVHGRSMSPITGEDRLLARRLARRTVEALVKAALETPAPSSRETYLSSLLAKAWISN